MPQNFVSELIAGRIEELLKRISCDSSFIAVGQDKFQTKKLLFPVVDFVFLMSSLTHFRPISTYG